jgi:hypothetical protein
MRHLQRRPPDAVEIKNPAAIEINPAHPRKRSRKSKVNSVKHPCRAARRKTGREKEKHAAAGKGSVRAYEQIALKNLVRICIPKTSTKQQIHFLLIFACHPHARHQHPLFMNQNTWLFTPLSSSALLVFPIPLRQKQRLRTCLAIALGRVEWAAEHPFSMEFLKGISWKKTERSETMS